MSEAEQLEEIKKRLGITGEYQDDAVQNAINDVKFYLVDAGIPTDVLLSDASLGVIARGVVDSWNYGSGEGEFSKMFYQRAEQLRHMSEVIADE